MKIILGFTNKTFIKKITYILRTNGLNADICLNSICDLQRLFNNNEKFILISQFIFPDGNLIDLNERENYIFCLSNTIDESFAENINAFVLRSPVNTQLLIKSINMLLKINTCTNIATNTSYIGEAKKILIKELDLTEDAAHKFIQKNSMNLCINKSILCEIIYSTFKNF
ncbi:MAG: ANTAR domain-containing protein [Lachnospirales bacterium]